MKKLVVLFLLISHTVAAQVPGVGKVRGRVTDSQGTALPFAAVSVKGTSQGTTTNEDGDYALPLLPGSYELVFQFVGYKAKNMNVVMLGEDQLVDIVLEAEVLMLKEIQISARDEDPAYGIIRQAQAKRRYYLREEIKSYQCAAYTKGVNRLTKRPNAVFGIKITADTGVVYLSESISEIKYKQPEKYTERVISSKVAGNSRGFTFNKASDAWVNLYENIGGEGMTARGIVSPIAPNAMAYYRYRLEGYFQEGNEIINKIRLIPRRSNAPAFGGYIYIVEGSWRIHSAEVVMRKGVIDFVDSAVVKQVYRPVRDSVWLPHSQTISFNFSAFGFEGNGYFFFFYNKYEVEPNLPPRTFKDPVSYTVEQDANKRDSTYWREIRPVPLTEYEIKSYRIKDSMQVIKESRPYQDSLDRTRNKLSLSKIFLFGYSYNRSFRKESFYFEPFFSTFQYNTIEGLVTDLTLNYRRRYEDRRDWGISPTIRYGFVNTRLQAKVETYYNFNPNKFANISVSGGKYVEQISRLNSINPFTNTLYTLTQEQNYLKLYEKIYGRVSYGQEFWHGIRATLGVEYAQRRPLENTANFKWVDVADREYTPNQPFAGERVSTAFNTNNALITDLTLQFNFGRKYAVYPDRKFVIEDPYPTLQLIYRKGINAFGSEVDFDMIRGVALDETEMGMLGKADWLIEGGGFLNTSRMTFVDYRHFGGNQTLFINTNNGGYQLLDYYQYSTNDWYVKAHYTHHFGGFLTNSIPLFKRLKWHLVASANYLYTPTLGNYVETGVGLENIFKLLRVDYVWGIREGQYYDSGLRLGFNF